MKQLCSCLLFCLLLSMAKAQYYLGFTRKEVKKELKKKYGQQGRKVRIAEGNYFITAIEQEGTDSAITHTYFFHGCPECVAYRAQYSTDSARQVAVRQILGNAEEGWQGSYIGLYAIRDEKQLYLHIRQDTPLYHFNVYTMGFTKEQYDTALAWRQRNPQAEQKFNDRTKPIVWEPGIRLKSDNYINKSGSHTSTVPLYTTACNLFCDIGKPETDKDSVMTIPVNIYAVMLPANSWLPFDLAIDEPIPLREQLYFDMTELVARQVRQQISLRLFSPKRYKQQIHTIINKAAAALAKLQKDYKESVGNDINSPNVQLWREDIHKRLKELNPYTKHQVAIDVR
jgi:hypothetical protein